MEKIKQGVWLGRYICKGNAGVLKLVYSDEKPRVEQKDKCWFGTDFHYEYES